jgi:methyltransferase (TIGR00027 family)
MAEGGPSTTARHVAAHRLECVRIATAFGRPEDDDRLARDVAAGIEVRRAGMHRYLLARTAFFDRVVVAAIADGIDQLVTLGAGYDGRSLRYAHDGVRFFEVDLARTQADKLGRLARLGVETSGVTFVAADFAADDVGARLVAAGLGDRPAAFLLEGVVPYLDEATLRRLLTAVATVPAAPSTLAISAAGQRRRGLGARRRTAQFRRRVASFGEPVRSTLHAGNVAALLAGCGWTLVDGPFGDPELDELDVRLGFRIARRP